MPSHHLILCCPLFPLPSISPSIKVFACESALCIRWPKDWSFSYIQGWFPFGLTGLILLSKGLSRVFQHHSSKALILQRSAFFMVLLSHPYMTTGRTIALTLWTFVSKVMSLLFNVLSKFAIVFRRERIPVPWTWVLFHINCKDCFPSIWVWLTDIGVGLLSCFPVDLSPQRSFSASSSIHGQFTFPPFWGTFRYATLCPCSRVKHSGLCL